MNTSLRILPTVARDGATQMSLDEAMMLSTEKGVATFRLYTWCEPTLSLGYFQTTESRLGAGAVTGLPYVRRSSGGGAILHHHELTYCLALPEGKAWHSGESWTCRFHHLLVKTLRRFGVEAKTVVCGEEKKLGAFLCFEHQTPGDVVVDGVSRNKIVGSAQRRYRDGTMQHGSILLGTSEWTPTLPGIEELVKRPISVDEFGEAILDELKADTDWELVRSDWTGDELRQAAEIRGAKYCHPAWNDKR